MYKVISCVTGATRITSFWFKVRILLGFFIYFVKGNIHKKRYSNDSRRKKRQKLVQSLCVLINSFPMIINKYYNNR